MAHGNKGKGDAMGTGQHLGGVFQLIIVFVIETLAFQIIGTETVATVKQKVEICSRQIRKQLLFSQICTNCTSELCSRVIRVCEF